MIRLFLARTFQDRSVWPLPVLACMLTSGIAFMVVGGSRYFFTLEHPLAGFYAVLAAVALILLTVPMVSLLSSSARLMARRRDERLSSLRLLGATTSQLRLLAVSEAVLLAAAGVLAGTVLYAVLMPLVGLIPFAGTPMGVSGLWIGPGLWGLTAAALMLLAAGASLAGMRRIEITPLGVRTMAAPARVHWVRIVVAVLGVLAAQLLAQLAGVGGMAAAITMMLAAVAVPLVVVQLVGPWVLKLITTGQLRRATTAERLIAARSVLESPQQMFRQVGGVAITTYAGVIAGSGLGLVSLADPSQADAGQTQLIADIQRGVWLTLAISFLMAACSVGINQTAQLLDRRRLYASLHMMGMSRGQLQRIRTLAVMRAVGAVVGVALVAAAVTAFPLVGAAVLVAPAAVATSLGVLGLGVLCVFLGAQVTRPALHRVLAPIG